MSQRLESSFNVHSAPKATGVAENRPLYCNKQKPGPLARLASLGILAGAAFLFVPIVFAQVVDFSLNGSLEGAAGGRPAKAALYPGASFITEADASQAIEPGPEGPAVVIPVPSSAWRSKGTLAFRFSPSRTVRGSAQLDPSPLRIPLFESPLLLAELVERSEQIDLDIRLVATDGPQPRAVLALSRLEGGKFYHLALAWDAEAGLLEAYLNGVKQAHPRSGRASGPWTPPGLAADPWMLGGSVGKGASAVKIAVARAQLFSAALNEQEVAESLKALPLTALAGEGRTVYEGTLDLSPYQLEPVYEADFSKPLHAVTEAELFPGRLRQALPEGVEWVLEGPGRAWTEKGKLHLETLETRTTGYAVAWNTQVFPKDFLLEFRVSPSDPKRGEGIVIFAARSKTGTGKTGSGKMDGGKTARGIFKPGLLRRSGLLENYTRSILDSYQISYWASPVSETGGATPRRTATLRKNAGFRLLSIGTDNIAPQGPGTHGNIAPQDPGLHRVRILKVGGKIQLEAAGTIALRFEDDGETYGPILGEGHIGLAQSARSGLVTYCDLRVWRIRSKGKTAE